MLDTGKSRRKRTLPTPEAEDGARREMDRLLIENFQARCQYEGEQIAELVRTVRGFNGTPGLTERMTRMETVLVQQGITLAEQKATLAEMHALLQGLVSAKAVEQPPAETKKPEEAQVVTKGTLALMTVDFGKTVVTAVVVWALLTLGPQLMAHLWAP